MNQNLQRRLDRFLPNGIPRYVRVYDNRNMPDGGSIDRFTVVFTGNYPGREGLCRYLAMSGAPFHPQGFCQHGESDRPIDYPTYGHLGRKINFQDLPGDCQEAVLYDYLDYWELRACDKCGRPGYSNGFAKPLCRKHWQEYDQQKQEAA